MRRHCTAVWVLFALHGQLSCDNKPSGSRAPAASAASSPAPAATGSTGVKACDDYFAAVGRCRAKVSAETARELDDTAAQYRKQLADAEGAAARGMVATGCEAAREAIEEDGCE